MNARRISLVLFAAALFAGCIGDPTVRKNKDADVSMPTEDAAANDKVPDGSTSEARDDGGAVGFDASGTQPSDGGLDASDGARDASLHEDVRVDPDSGLDAGHADSGSNDADSQPSEGGPSDAAPNSGDSSTEGGLGDSPVRPISKTVGRSGPLRFAVTAAVYPAVPAGTLRYTFMVSNTSSVTVDGVGVLFRVPVGLQFHYTIDAEPNAVGCGNVICKENTEASWSLGSLPAGATRSVTLNTSILGTVGAGSTIAAQVRFSATNVNPVNVDKTVAVVTEPPIRLALDTLKDQFLPDETFNYEIHVGHIGPQPLTGAQLGLNLPDGLTYVSSSDGGSAVEDGKVTWTLGNIAVGASLRRTVRVRVDSAVIDGALLPASTELTYAGGVGVVAAAEQLVFVLPSPPLLATSLVAASGPVIPGAPIPYVLSIGNTSNRAVENISVMLRLPAGTRMHYTIDTEPDSLGCGNVNCPAHSEASWNIGTLAAGASATIDFNLSPQQAEVGDGDLVTAELRVTSDATPPLRLSKTLSTFSAPSAALHVSTLVNPVTAGQTFVVNFDVGHIGAAALSNATLTAALPAGLTAAAVSDGGSQADGTIVWNLGSIAVGKSVRRTLEVTPTSALAPAGASLSFLARLSYDGSMEEDATAGCVVSAVAASLPLGVGITATPSPVAPGGRVLYTLTLTNNASRALEGVAAKLRLPVGSTFHYVNDTQPDSQGCGNVNCPAGSEASWSIGTMAAGATQIITLNLLVLNTNLSGTPVVAPFRVTANGFAAPFYARVITPTQ